MQATIIMFKLGTFSSGWVPGDDPFILGMWEERGTPLPPRDSQPRGGKRACKRARCRRLPDSRRFLHRRTGFPVSARERGSVGGRWPVERSSWRALTTNCTCSYVPYHTFTYRWATITGSLTPSNRQKLHRGYMYYSSMTHYNSGSLNLLLQNSTVHIRIPRLPSNDGVSVIFSGSKQELTRCLGHIEFTSSGRGLLILLDKQHLVLARFRLVFCLDYR